LLYVATAVLGVDIVPGAYRFTPASFAGMPIRRVYAPGGVLIAFGFFWGVAQIVTRTTSRHLARLLTPLTGLALLMTLSRTIIVSTVIALSLMSVWAARSSGKRSHKGRYRAVVVVIIIIMAAAFGNGRLGDALSEIGHTSGNFGVRVMDVQQRRTLIDQHWLLGVGFAPNSPPTAQYGPPIAQYDISDSSALTFVIRFGYVGVVLMLSILGLVVRDASRMRRRDDPQERALATLTMGFIVFLVVASVTTDALVSPGGLALLGLVVSASTAQATRRVRERDTPLAHRLLARAPYT